MVATGLFFLFLLFFHYLFKTKEYAGKDASLIKPILRPLSDLTNKIKINDNVFIPAQNIFEKAYNTYVNGSQRTGQILPWKKHPTLWKYIELTKLFEWHFDVFGLIEAGLAIDINTLKYHYGDILKKN